MPKQPPLQPPPPVLTAGLFPEVLSELLKLLRVLTPEDWQKPTACEGWTVKDVALHLLGVEISNLSRRRDNHILGGEIASWDELVSYINRWNETWVEASRRISPQLLIDLLDLTGRQMNSYFRALDPHAMGGPVSWAGPDPAPVWLDVAREYTERWHHQQHIRDAVGRPGLKQVQYMAPALATFVWAMPNAFRTTAPAHGAAVTLTITGPSGGRWSISEDKDKWQLYMGAPSKPTAEVIVDEDVAWRLFTHTISRNEAQAKMKFKGAQTLGLTVLEMTSIIA